MKHSRVFSGLAAGALLMALSACASSDSGGDDTVTKAPDAQTSAPSGEGTQQAVPPIMADVETIDGSTQKVPLGRQLVVQGGTSPVEGWKATTDPQGVVTFQPGRTDGSATYNPGFTANKVGSTEVTMTNAEGNVTVTFTIEVTSAAS